MSDPLLGELFWLAVNGLVIGAVARFLIPRSGGLGCLTTIIAGVVGSMVAGLAGRELVGEGYVPTLIPSILGAMLVVWLIVRFRP